MRNIRDLPPVDGLTEGQIRGVDCVWCGITLDNGTAVDLRPRPISQAGVGIRWFPRACPRHWEAS